MSCCSCCSSWGLGFEDSIRLSASSNLPDLQRDFTVEPKGVGLCDL